MTVTAPGGNAVAALGIASRFWKLISFYSNSQVTVLALRDQMLPPTINLDQPQPGFDLDFVPRVARSYATDIAISNSFGFGGHNATLVFKRYEA